MSRIETNFAQLTNNSTAFHDMGQRVRAMNDSLTDITGNLDSVIHTSFSASQIMILKAISDKMIESASRLDTFSEALEYIRNQYLRSEQMLINGEIFKIAWLDSCIFQNNLLPLHAKYAMNEESAQ